MGYASCLILIIGFFALISGCDEDANTQETETPKVLSVSVGGELPPGWSNHLKEGSLVFPGTDTIVADFSKRMEWAEIDISCATGTTTLDSNGEKAVWEAASVKYSDLGFDSSDIGILEEVLDREVPPDFAETWTIALYPPAGIHTLTINGADAFGQELKFTPINFTVTPLDMDPPMIGDSKCDPRNGAENVDPQKYAGKIVIAFDEAMSEVDILDTDPEFPFNERLSADSKALVISFGSGYTMPYNTKFTVKLTGLDLAGTRLLLIRYDIYNCEPERVIYSFTTMPQKTR